MRAVVDIGSNSVKYVLAENQRGVPRIVAKGSEVTRLGFELEKTRKLSEGSLQKTQLALENFAQVFRKEGVTQQTQCVVLATSAVRDCQNPERIHEIVQSTLQCPVHVLSGKDEARISQAGAQLAGEIFFPSQRLLFIEVGGASSQISISEPRFEGISLQYGAVRVHERLGFARRALTLDEFSDLDTRLRSFLDVTQLQTWWKNSANQHPFTSAVGIGGSLVLAAKASGASKVNDVGYRSTRLELETFNKQLALLDATQRSERYSIEAGREDILVSGIGCLTTLLGFFGIQEVGISEWGLRHGALKLWDEFFKAP